MLVSFTQNLLLFGLLIIYLTTFFFSPPGARQRTVDVYFTALYRA